MTVGQLFYDSELMLWRFSLWVSSLVIIMRKLRIAVWGLSWSNALSMCFTVCVVCVCCVGQAARSRCTGFMLFVWWRVCGIHAGSLEIIAALPRKPLVRQQLSQHTPSILRFLFFLSLPSLLTPLLHTCCQLSHVWNVKKALNELWTWGKKIRKDLCFAI